eukprot:g3800.t1
MGDEQNPAKKARTENVRSGVGGSNKDKDHAAVETKKDAVVERETKSSRTGGEKHEKDKEPSLSASNSTRPKENGHVKPAQEQKGGSASSTSKQPNGTHEKKSAKVSGEADGASKPAAKKALPARPFFGEKRMFQYLKLVEPASDGSQAQQTPPSKRRELDKRRLRNERDLWSEFFQHLKEEFAASICFSLEDVQGFISDCVRAVTFDWIPVASGVQLLQFVLESPHQHRWTCDCLNDKLLEKKPEDCTAAELDADLSRAQIIGVDVAQKRKALAGALTMDSAWLQPPPADPKVSNASKDPYLLNFEELVVGLTKYRVFSSRLEAVAAIDAPDFLPNQIGRKDIVQRKKNQLRTKEKFTFTRYNLFRENPAAYAELLILMRQLVHVGSALPNPQAEEIAREIRKNLNDSIMAALRENGVLNQNSNGRSGGIENEVFGLPQQLTETELIEQFHTLCGRQSLDLGRVASMVLDYLSFALSLYRLPVEILGYELSVRAEGGPAIHHDPYGDNPIVRMTSVLMRLLRRVVPRSRIAEVIQYRIKCEYFETLPAREKDYRAKVAKYEEAAGKCGDAKEKWDKAFKEQAQEEDRERDARRNAQRMRGYEADRVIKAAQKATDNARGELSRRAADAQKARGEYVKAYEELTLSRKHVSEVRRNVDFVLVGFLIHCGVLDADRIWSQLPSQLWRGRELEGFWVTDADLEAKEKDRRVDDLTWLRERFFGEKLRKAQEESVKMVTAVNKSAGSEQAYEEVLAKANLLDSPCLRLCQGLLSVNSWQKARGILENIGPNAGLIQMLRSELVTLLLWVLDPLVRRFETDPAWTEGAGSLDAKDLKEKAKSVEFKGRWERGTPVPEVNTSRGYERQLQKFLRYPLSGTSALRATAGGGHLNSDHATTAAASPEDDLSHLDQRHSEGPLPTSGQAFTAAELRLENKDFVAPQDLHGNLTQCGDMRDFLSSIEPILVFLESGLHMEPQLLETLWKLTREYVRFLHRNEQQAGGAAAEAGGAAPMNQSKVSTMNAPPGINGPDAVLSDPRILPLLTRVLLPANGQVHAMGDSLVSTTWQTLSLLSGVTRWSIYQQWWEQYEVSPPMQLVRARVRMRMDRTLKRAVGGASKSGGGAANSLGAAGAGSSLSSGANDGGAGNEARVQLLIPHVSRMSDPNPLIVYENVVEQIARAYNDNLIVPILAMTKRISPFAADVAGFVCIQECFARSLSGNRSLLSEGAQSVEGWLQNLAKWIALFFAMHPDTEVGLVLHAVADFIERHAVQGLDPDTFGNSLMQIVVTNLIAHMGAWSYVTELSELQLQSLSGGEFLRTEHIYTQNAQFETNDTAQRNARAQEILLKTLQTTDVVRRFWRSLGLMRKATTSDDNLSNVLQQMRGEAVSNLKKVGYLYDQTHQCLMTITQFLGRSLKQSQYLQLLPPDIASIFTDFEPAFAFTMIRPALPGYHEDLHNESHLLDDVLQRLQDDYEESVLASAQGKQSSREISAVAVAVGDDEFHQDHLEGVISKKFRYAFWRLELGDITSPASQYDKAINAHDKAAKDLRDEIEKLRGSTSSSGVVRAELAQKQRLRDEKLTAKSRLRDERDAQLKRVFLTLRRIQKEKAQWFLGTNNSERITKGLVSEFIAKRLLLSYEDALFCSYLVYLLVKTKTRGICAADLGQKIFDSLSAKVDACTEDEARILGVFVAAFFRSMSSIVEDKDMFQGPNPCMEKQYYVNGEREYLNEQNMRWHLERWEKTLYLALKASLKSKDWLTRRNALNILSKTMPVFPFTVSVGEKLANLVKKIETKDGRKDMQLLAKSLFMQLRGNKANWKDGEGVSVVKEEEEQVAAEEQRRKELEEEEERQREEERKRLESEEAARKAEKEAAERKAKEDLLHEKAEEEASGGAAGAVNGGPGQEGAATGAEDGAANVSGIMNNGGTSSASSEGDELDVGAGAHGNNDDGEQEMPDLEADGEVGEHRGGTASDPEGSAESKRAETNQKRKRVEPQGSDPEISSSKKLKKL